MIIDANVLLYAVDTQSPQHATTRSFLEQRLTGDMRVALPWQSLGAFLRIATHPRIMTSPLTAQEAAEFIDDWLSAPTVWIPEITSTTWAILRDLVTRHAVTGNLVPDAQLAALAVQYGLPLASADTDFARFPEIEWVNPCL